MARDAGLVMGIDEAGRGPLLGPLVLASVTLSPAAARSLRRRGVADSKSFGSDVGAQARRAKLAALIRQRADDVRLAVAGVHEIDQAVARGHLNRLEHRLALSLIEVAPPVRRIYADGSTLFSPLARAIPAETRLIAVDEGESAHVAVAAASIVAKDRRDELFACIAARYAAHFGPVRGGGYVNDATRRFVRAYVHKFGALPPEMRWSWTCHPRFVRTLGRLLPRPVRSAWLAAQTKEGATRSED